MAIEQACRPWFAILPNCLLSGATGFEIIYIGLLEPNNLVMWKAENASWKEISGAGWCFLALRINFCKGSIKITHV